MRSKLIAKNHKKHGLLIGVAKIQSETDRENKPKCEFRT